MEELPARKEEVEHAMEEGIIFKLLTNPVRVLGDEMAGLKEWNVYRWNWENQMPAEEDVQ